MCEIALKFSKFTKKEIDNVRTTHSDGDGFFTKYKTGLISLIKDVDGEKAIKEYLDKVNENKVLFTLYHVRNASAGAVKQENVQPFYSSKNKFVFAHNGTLTRQDLCFLAYAKNKLDRISYNSSDSRMLFQILKDESVNKIIKLLCYINDNFVIVLNNKIYFIGTFGYKKDKNYIVKSFQANKTYAVFDYSGKQIEGNKLEEIEPFPIIYQTGFGYTGNQRPFNSESRFVNCSYIENFTLCPYKNYYKCNCDEEKCPYKPFK